MAEPERDRLFSRLLPEDFFSRICSGAYNKKIYPTFQERSLWEKALKEKSLGKDLIRNVEDVPEELPPLPFSLYCEFGRTGNRVNYERNYFARRENLQKLVLAMCLSGDREKYMEKILTHIVGILEEWSWTMPAHTVWPKEKGTPDLSFLYSDLFCCETGAVLAMTVMLIGEELDAKCEGITRWIRKVTMERTLYNVLDNPLKHWWVNSLHPCNWTVWCAYNILLTAFLLEENPAKTEEAVRFFAGLLDRYVDDFPEDGYSVEGPMYYFKSGLKLFMVLDLFERCVEGSTEKHFASCKIRSIIDYISKLRVAGVYTASFGDATPRINPEGKVLSAAKRLASPDMMALAQDCRIDIKTFGNTGAFYTGILPLLLELDLSQLKQYSYEQEKSTFFKDRLGITRTNGFSAFLKGGTNHEEPHNHNDLGQFGIYWGNEPIIVDAGTGGYSRKNFGAERYSLWYTRGSGHNAPVINGVEQSEEDPCVAPLEMKNPKEFLCDLTHAYGQGVKMEKFLRTLKTDECQVVVEDTFICKNPSSLEKVITLFTPCTVEKISANELLLGKIRLQLENLSFTGMEEMEVLKTRIRVNCWPAPLKALRFRTGEDHYRLIFSIAEKKLSFCQ